MTSGESRAPVGRARAGAQARRGPGERALGRARLALRRARDRAGHAVLGRRPAVRVPLAGLSWARTDVSGLGPGAMVHWVARESIAGETLPALRAHVPTVVEYRLLLPSWARLHARLSLQPEAWDRSPEGVVFAVEVLDPAGRELRRWRRRLDPRHVAADRGWVGVEIELGRQAGEVLLRLRTLRPPGASPEYGWAQWGAPALLVPEAAAPPAPAPPPAPRPAAGPTARAASPSSGGPRISVLMPVHDPDPAFLAAAIASVRAQAHERWELCLFDDGSTDPEVRRVLEQQAAADPARVRLARGEPAAGIAAATNGALELASGELVALLDHDDVLSPQALAAVAAALADAPEADLLYTDEDMLGPGGERVLARWKPGWSPELLESCMYLGHLIVLRTALVRELGGLRGAYDGSQDYDLVLRASERARRIVRIPGIHYRWRLHAGSSSASESAKPYAYEAARRAIADHIERNGRHATVARAATPGFYRVREQVEPGTLAAILLDVGADRAELAGRVGACLRAVVAGTAHEAWELLVTGEPAALERCEATLAAVGDPRIRALPAGADADASRSARLDRAARATDARQLVLLDQPLEPLDPDWLETLLGFAGRAEVGAAGALVLDRDGRALHAGVVLGAGAAPLAAFPGIVPEPTVHRLIAACDYLAVDGAWATRREVFLSLGGLGGAFGGLDGVDYCLRAQAAGQRAVFTPDVRLAGDPEASPRTVCDLPALLGFRRRWEATATPDPYYHPELWQERATFAPG